MLKTEVELHLFPEISIGKKQNLAFTFQCLWNCFAKKREICSCLPRFSCFVFVFCYQWEICDLFLAFFFQFDGNNSWDRLLSLLICSWLWSHGDMRGGSHAATQQPAQQPAQHCDTYKYMLDAVFVFIITVLFPCGDSLDRNTVIFILMAAIVVWLVNCSWTDAADQTCGPKASSKPVIFHPTFIKKQTFAVVPSFSFKLFLYFISCFVYLACMSPYNVPVPRCLNRKHCSSLQVYYLLVFFLFSKGSSPRVGALFVLLWFTLAFLFVTEMWRLI